MGMDETTNTYYEFYIWLKDESADIFHLSEEEAQRISQDGLKWYRSDENYKFVDLDGWINEYNPQEVVRTRLAVEPNVDKAD